MRELGVYRGPREVPVRVLGSWQARLFGGEPNPSQSKFDFVETMEESLTFRNNAYVWLSIDPSSGQVVEWWALHPDQVFPRLTRDGSRSYQVATAPGLVDPVGRGYGFYTVDEDTMLHVKGHGDGGAWIAPSPIQQNAEAIGSALAKIRHEANTYAKGASIRLAVTYPDNKTQEQVAAWRDMWQATYEGPQNAGKTAVLGGGGSIQTIGLTQADAQFIESMHFSVEEIGRIFNVPASLIGGGTTGKSSDNPLTPEHEASRWLTYFLSPRFSRIESAIAHHPRLFGSGASTYPMFGQAGIVRGDLATEEQMSHQQVQDGRLLVDEWRAKHGLPPLPGGVGMIPLITPAGAAPNPVAIPAVTPDPVPV